VQFEVVSSPAFSGSPNSWQFWKRSDWRFALDFGGPEETQFFLHSISDLEIKKNP